MQGKGEECGRSRTGGRRVSRRLEKNRLGFYCERLIDTLKLLEPYNSQWFTSVEATSAAKLVRRVWLFVNLSWLISPLRKLLSQRSPPPSPPLSPCLSQPQFNQALSLYLWMLPNIIISNQMQLGPTMFAGTLKGTLQTGTMNAISCMRASWVTWSSIRHPSPLSAKLSKSSTLVAITMRLFLHSGRPFLTITSALVSSLHNAVLHPADCWSVKGCRPWQHEGTSEWSSNSSPPSFDESNEEMLEIKEALRTTLKQRNRSVSDGFILLFLC